MKEKVIVHFEGKNVKSIENNERKINVNLTKDEGMYPIGDTQGSKEGRLLRLISDDSEMFTILQDSDDWYIVDYLNLNKIKPGKQSSIKIACEIELEDGTFKELHETSTYERRDARAKKMLDDLNNYLKGKDYNE